ncbi:hypothetical protein C7R54_12575 [Achromobacter aloeverae]|uniref:Helix-turn-helix domain-containing protein n=2 Tax=Achromobacter aloeverae TaxID=1750518 RepID=A0A4Q1HJQ1_9BURK|nr:hypothetical protein C7R54_12575 [Achromobacter aloeverae]
MLSTAFRWRYVDSANQRAKNHAMTKKEESVMISSREASELLGVSLRTLYSYISRGKLGRTIDDVSGGSLFNRAEVQDYVRRRDRGRNPKTAARASLNFGLPVLDSAVCAIKGGRPWFRGIDAIAYSETATLEDTAALLWDKGTSAGIFDQQDRASDDCPGDEEGGGLKISPLERGPFLNRFSAWLLLQDGKNTDLDFRSHAALTAVASRIVYAAVSIAAGSTRWRKPVHEVLGDAWGLPLPRHDVLRRILVLHADHELNPSSFVVRCTASTLASPYAATLAGCCAARGVKHADFTQAYTLIARIVDGEDAMRLVSVHEPGSETLPGFNHPLYPKGDPRAGAILHSLRAHAAPGSMQRIDAFLDAARTQCGVLPKNDFAVAAAAHVLGLPADACAALFIISRTVGWNAHALEQYHSPYVIRPRAQYVPE